MELGNELGQSIYDAQGEARDFELFRNISEVRDNAKPPRPVQDRAAAVPGQQALQEGQNCFLEAFL